jgi:hypothetical protein
MGLGGPVWHVSVEAKRPMPSAQLYKLALRVLRGVGDAVEGEWFEEQYPFIHVRRRLSASEAALVGPVVDVRGTDEARRRAEAVGSRLAHAPAEILMEEIGERP